MNIKFSLDRKIVVQTVLYMNYKRPATIILQLIGLAVLIYCIYGAINKTEYFEQRGVLLLTLSIYLCLVAPLILLLRAFRISRKKSRIMEKTEMIFSVENLKICGESYNYEYKWDKINKVSCTSFAYLIYLSKNQVHILPRKELSYDSEIQLRGIISAIPGLKLEFDELAKN